MQNRTVSLSDNIFAKNTRNPTRIKNDVCTYTNFYKMQLAIQVLHDASEAY